ncbi:MAG: hypothetical protein RIS76_2296 [Verrucomicrobiota bacterium]
MVDLGAQIGAGVALLEFGLQLGADGFVQLFVLGDERVIEVAVAKDKGVAASVEANAAADPKNPGEDQVDHDLGLDFVGLGKDELNGGFVAGGANPDFFGTGQFLVAADALQGIRNEAGAFRRRWHTGAGSRQASAMYHRRIYGWLSCPLAFAAGLSAFPGELRMGGWRASS